MGRPVFFVYRFDPTVAVQAQGGGLRYVHGLLHGIAAIDSRAFYLIGPHAQGGSLKYKNVTYLPLSKRKLSTESAFVAALFRARKWLPKNAILHALRPYYGSPFIDGHSGPKVASLMGVMLDDAFSKRHPRLSMLVRPGFERWEARHLIKYDLLVPVSKDVRDRYGMKYPELRSRMEVFPNSVDTEFFKCGQKGRRAAFNALLPRIEADGPVIIAVGRLVAFKGFELLLKALPHVLAAESRAHVVVVGDGDERRALAELAQQLGIASKVTFAGQVTGPSLVAMLCASDVLAITSHSEGGPMTMLEALACGVPVVATRVGQVPEIITNKVLGEVVPDRNDSLFAEALVRTIRRERNGSSALPVSRRQEAMKFGNRSVARFLEKLYHRVEHRNLAL